MNQLYDVFMQTPAIISVHRGPEHVFELANPLYLASSGRADADELIGKPLREAMPELEGQGFSELADQVYASGEPFAVLGMPAKIDRQRNGILEEGFFNLTIQPLKDRSGNVEGLIAHSVEVTEQVRARRHAETLAGALQESEEFNRSILESSADCIKVLDLEGRLLTMNSGGHRAFEIDDPGLVVGASWLDFWKGADHEAAAAAFEAARAGGVGRFQGYCPTMKGTPKWWDVIVTPIRDGAGRLVRLVSISRDITERREAERERERLLAREQEARAEAEAANRAKDEFLSVLSHELRTPLTPILGFTQMLRRRLAQDASVAQALETINRSARAQSRLVADLLDVSRMVTGKLHLETAPTVLIPVVQAAVATIQAEAEAKAVRLIFELDAATGVVLGDADRLEQVVWNLLSNAVKFTPEGGTVTVRLGREDGSACLTVTDTGKGIAPDFLPYVFDRFRQADSSPTRVYGGLGLGLAIVHHLVEMHGGSVSAASAGEGQGATFTVRLPLADERPRPAEQHDQNGGGAGMGETARLAGVRVLVLEDEANTRAFLRLMLEAEGATVTAAASTAAALAALDAAKPDMVLADIGLPGEDGYSFISALRARPGSEGGAVPALALTAYTGHEDRQRALTAGFQAHLAKPADPDAVVAALSDLLHRPARS